MVRWHQNGESLQTMENLRSWINAAGLVLFAPRPQVAAPAPTLMEAVLGAAKIEPSLDSTREARALLARLVAEGVVLPLSLMGAGAGTPGDTPDFVVSAAAFAYVFTLRGDKAWKQPPATSGPLKVSNLALATYEALTAKGPLTAYDLATQLGKEVTETACLRALNELWSHLRVIPLFDVDGGATRWELTSARYTKQIKAGANAGQPTALSALTSLYLGQAMAASEEEVESFLSPLAPRSRIREVIHALLSARQLDTLAVEGKTMLHVSGEAPAFAAPLDRIQPATHIAVAASADTAETGEGDSRITKYVPKPRKVGTGFLAKGKPVAGKRPFQGERTQRPSEGFQRREGRGEQERRPFRKLSNAPPKPRFDKPWEEGRPRREHQGEGRPRSQRGPNPNRDRERTARTDFRDRSPRDKSGPPRSAQTKAKPWSNSARPHQGNRPEGARPARPAFRRFDDPKRERGERQRDGENRRHTSVNRRPPQRTSGDGAARTSSRPGTKSGFGSRSRQDSDRARGQRQRDSRSDTRPPRRDRNSEEPRPRREGSGPGNARESKPGRSFGSRGAGPAKGKFPKHGHGKKTFGKTASGSGFKPRKTSRPRPKRDDSA